MTNPAEAAQQGQPIFSLRVLASSSLPKGTEITLEAERIALGSDPERCGVALVGDVKVSGTHAALQREGEDFVLYDTDSVSGTLVNGEELHRGRKLVPGDKIQIGDTVLTFAKRRIWTQEAKSLREMAPDLLAVLAILVIAGGVLYVMPEPPEPRILTQSAAVVKDLPIDENTGLVEWDSAAFQTRLPGNRTAQEDANKAKRHFERGLRCYKELTLDLSNAFSAILELRRAKAYLNANPEVQNLLPTHMDMASADELIQKCRSFLKKRYSYYNDGYMKACAVGDYAKAAFFCRRVMSTFSGKFNGEKSKEYEGADRALAGLGQEVLQQQRAGAEGVF